MADESAETPKKGEGEAAAEASGEGKGKKKMLLILLVVLVVIAATAGGAAFFLLSSPKDAGHAEETAHPEESHPPESTTAKPAEEKDKPAEAKPEEKKDAKDAPKDTKETKEGAATAPAKPEGAAASEPQVPGVNFGSTYTFKTFHLNLGNPLENHYIRLEIAVEFKGGENQRKEIEQRLPQLRDAVVSVTSRKTREFLLGPDGKDQLRREILIRMNRYMNQPLESVFLTDILIE
jgi:flagellar FliL protein